ncbi:uncharacterized protein METZ01_LOCUS489487, partial [marine metagenome]
PHRSIVYGSACPAACGVGPKEGRRI